MKLRVNRKDLSKHISIVQKAISSRTTMQILEGIKMKASENTLILTATDTEISIMTKLSAIVEQDGEIVVNSRLFGDIIRKLTSDTININVENYTMNLKSGKSIFNIACQKGDEYPDLPHIDDNYQLNINSKDLTDAIKKTAFAVSFDESRIVFTGVLMDIYENYINFVALDGFRMAVKTIRLNTGFQTSAIIPARSLNELTKIIENNNDIKINLSRNNIVFTFNNTVFYSTLLSGDFFKYEGLLRDNHDVSIEVNKSDFQLAVERASLLAREERANLIKLNILENIISISSNSEIGNVYEEVETSNNNKELNIAFNSRYVLEGIKILENENITLNFTDSVNPCIIKEENDKDYIYLVLPVRLAN